MAAPRKRVLVIDNEPGFADLVKLTLEASGSYEVQTEMDAVRAVATARAFRPDLILMDIVMPGGGGGSIATQIKKEPDLNRVAIVFMSAMVARRERETGERNIAGHPLLAKPVRAAELLDCVEKQLGRSGAA